MGFGNEKMWDWERRRRGDGRWDFSNGKDISKSCKKGLSP